MKTQQTKQNFRQFRVDSICSTSNPDAILNESGLDDFVAGKAGAATGKAGEKAKEIGAKTKEKIDPTKTGKLKRAEKGEAKEKKKEQIKKLELDIKILSKEITGKVQLDDKGQASGDVEKVNSIKKQLELIDSMLNKKISQEMNDTGRIEDVTDDAGKKIKLNDNQIAKLESQKDEKKKDLAVVSKAKPLSDDQLTQKKEQVKDKQTQLKKLKLGKDEQYSPTKNFGEFVAEKRDQVNEAIRSDYDVIDALKTIVRKHQASKIKLLDGKQISVDAMSANALVKVYDALNSRNKVKFASTLAKNLAGFHKMSAFAIKNVSY
jgi:hypothetical protein